MKVYIGVVDTHYEGGAPALGSGDAGDPVIARATLLEALTDADLARAGNLSGTSSEAWEVRIP